MDVLFYTKPGCLLCDEAEQIMKLIQEDYPFSWTTINIEENDAKHEQYMLMIPVIERDGKALYSGLISYVDLVDLLESGV